MTRGKGFLRRAAMAALLGLAMLPVLAVSAGDVIDELKLDRQDAADSVFDSIFGGHYAYGVPLAVFKALPPARQVEVVNGLGAFIRACVESPAFKTRYAEAWKAAQPGPPEPRRTGAELVAEQQQKLNAQIAETEANMKKAPANQQEMYQTVLKALKQSVEAIGGQTSIYEMSEKMRYDAQLAGYQEKLADPMRLPEDPNKLVARRLQEFLDLTAGIDFNAALATKYATKRFVNESLESKSPEWKMCFRAGKPVVDAARAFAESWLKQLKVGP